MLNAIWKSAGIELIKLKETIMIKNQNDKDMTTRLIHGDASALEDIIEKYQSRVYNAAIHIVKNHNDAQEICQDVFYTVFRKISTFKGVSSFYTWIYRITVNFSLMKIRSQRNKKYISIDELHDHERNNFFIPTIIPDKTKHAEARLVEREFMHKVLATMEHLPDKYREIFELRDIKDFSNEEVGQMLNLSLAAVKSRVHRARRFIRAQAGDFASFLN